MNQAEPAGGTLAISVRESRMMLSRIFLAAGVPEGQVPSITDHALLSAAMGLGGYAMLAALHEEMGRQAQATALAVTTAADGTLDADAGGQHPWIIASTLTDLLVAAAQRDGRAVAVVRNVAEPSELTIVTALAHRHGARATVGADGRIELELAASPQSLAEWDPVLWRAIREHIPTDAALWWSVYKLSHRALSPDTVESRRHAGPIIIAADGRVIGRPVDDDTDVSFLTRPTSLATN